MEQNQQQQQQQFQCSGDCMRCNPLQRQYCAAQWAYNSMRMLEQMQRQMTAMQGTIGEMRTKIDAIQGSEASLFDPTQGGISPKPASETSDEPASTEVSDGTLFPKESETAK
ncbi:MAG: hypothetical protein IJ200_00005 [Prevotella sp.]|nr:hypothetical protein [Prevotella sp.]